MSIEIEVIGRIVWGNPLRKNALKDDAGKPRTTEEGEQRYAWSFGLAVAKADSAAVMEAMSAAAAEEFPQGTPDNFAWKFKDGDTGKDSQGRPNNAKEGWAGCNVFSLSTELQQPPCYVYNHSVGKWETTTNGIKTGDYVKVTVNLKAHKALNSKAKPGLYMNPSLVGLFKYGTEIKGGEIDPNQRFAPPPPPEMPTEGPKPGPVGATTPGPRPSGPKPDDAPAGGTQHRAFLNGPKPDQ